MTLSVVIPAHNEEGCLEGTLRAFATALHDAGITHEIVVVNDNSSDATPRIVTELARELPSVRLVDNDPPHGFGLAVRCGLQASTGDAIAIVMADASDSPQDLVRFYRVMQERDVDCVFGTRFHREARVIDYPRHKLALNRLANGFIQLLFGLKYNDVTNAFKLYRASVIRGVSPLFSHHFNLTVEIPLKAIVRGYTFAVVPNDWTNRKTGVSKLKIQEMGSRYLFIVLYCFLERWLSRGDYRHRPLSEARRATRAAARPLADRGIADRGSADRESAASRQPPADGRQAGRASAASTPEARVGP
jgi:dolichol-phosphate mannosyltransferase